MNDYFLCINDELLLNKLEFFIYDQSNLVYNDLACVINHALGNKKDIQKTKDRKNTYKLRSLLSYHNTNSSLIKSEIEDSIELFLMFLRTKNIEASMCLNALLDAVWEVEQTGREWQCVRRLTGILASMYLLFFVDRAKLLNKDETQNSMKEIFKQNINFYTLEDKKLLIHTFAMNKMFDCVIVLLKMDLKVNGVEEKFAPESECAMWDGFRLVLNRLYTSERYKDMILLFNESEHIFGRVNDEIRGQWEREKARALFYLGKYEAAEKILDKYVDKFDDTGSVYDLYNNAIICAWAANFKEKENAESYIKKAHNLIIRAEKSILQSNGRFSSRIYFEVILEKSFLLSEMEKYDEAYECLNTAFSQADDEIKKDSNFNTHLWILMKYMCLHPEKNQTVLDWINGFYARFGSSKLGRYKDIVNLFNTDEDLVKNPLSNEIYKNLLELLFHAMEILHETKIRDFSQFIFLYYTKSEHLRLLLEDETDNNSFYRLPIFHARHMNDPQEGKMLQSLLPANEIFPVDDENAYKENYVFLKSFFFYKKENETEQAKEFLPMWVQYGDDANGCCVILNHKTFENVKLRRIVYLSDQGKCSGEKDEKVQKYLDDFVSTYRHLLRMCKEFESKSKHGKHCLMKIRPLLEDIVSNISYLFKHDSYKHENEVRLIVNKTSSDLDDVKVISGKVPKLYIYSDSQTYIDEVVLGAKMENPEDYVPFIYKQGNKMWKDEKEKHIKVTRSRIQYR